MNFEGFKALRDARGLNSDEIAFLFVALSRGDELFGAWQTNAADMGLSKRGYYDTRAGLLAAADYRCEEVQRDFRLRGRPCSTGRVFPMWE
jgi:hypothetical protein